MTGTVAQGVAPQTCQSTSNSEDLQSRPSIESAANAINPMLQKLWSTLVPYLSVDRAEFTVSSPESSLRLHGKKQEPDRHLCRPAVSDTELRRSSFKQEA